MKKTIRFLLMAVLTVMFSSCHPYKSSYDVSALAKAAVKLGFDIDRDDNHDLYVEAAGWLGTPYRAGGVTKKGVDCSGLTMRMYDNVYRRTLPRSSDEQYSLCRRVPKRRIKEGDLVFFSTDGRRKKVGHVGIYLKNGMFIHSSSSAGVAINKLTEKYYADNYMYVGRVK
jgi:lipoprotein Spr